MNKKLFIIPWMFVSTVAQIAPPATQNQGAIAHQQTLYELLQRQQEINQAILMNNALLHSSMNGQHSGVVPPLAQPALVNRPSNFFIPFQHPQAQGILTHGGYIQKDGLSPVTPIIPTVEGTVTSTSAAPTTTTRSQVMVKSAEKRDESLVDDVAGVEDLEVVSLFKKLNLTDEETKLIVHHVEHVVREELTKKLREKEAEMEQSTVAATTTTEPTTTSTTTASTTTTEVVTTSTTHRPTTTSAEYDDELSVFINRNNLKHHPVSKSDSTKENTIDGVLSAIKTSDTHLPVSVQPEEESREERPRLKLVDRKKDQKASIHKRILITRTNDKESDKDLLVDFATGAPLELDEVGSRSSASTSAPETTTTVKALNHVAAHQNVATPPPSTPNRHSHHTMTKFEKLAVDYQRRLENTGDLNKILQKL